MASTVPVVFVLGCPGSGKTTLSALLTRDFPVKHISVGDLLRRIKNDTTHSQSGVIAPMLNRQELIDGNLLIPIIRSELEKIETLEPERRAVLVDGFPRNLAQLRIFEAEFEKPMVVLLFNCRAEIAKERYLTRNLEGRQTDDATMFEKRHGEFLRENEAIVHEYRERKLLIELDTSSKTDESYARLCNRLGGDIRWAKVHRQPSHAFR
ncbi:hypothetical protein N3K66_009091 [Trichothecium roseum]|uniref:Uncharacterized protein n=1 Tax=Trichothecium roseum TaxID=47278 RepID=A0ACC0UR74_9HYPO|nr:hypothetical protein N3K66_009091 [Trichothecium roseum]